MDDFLEMKDVNDMVRSALVRLIQEDYEIIEHNLEEETINRQLSIYLEQILFSSIRADSKPIDKISVDVEYNRWGDRTKTCGTFGKRFPDILIHQRFVPYNNFLIIEAKKCPSRNLTSDGFSKIDKRKISCHLRNLDFKYGCLINYNERNMNLFSSYIIFENNYNGGLPIPITSKHILRWSDFIY